MKSKGDGCYSITENELLHALSCGAVLWTENSEFYTEFRGRRLHPRRGDICRMIASGQLVRSYRENEMQRAVGMVTYALAEAKP